jgi:hypothetical protein
MKKILSITLLFLLNFSFAQVKWMTIEEALKAQKKILKKYLLIFMQTGVAHVKSWIKKHTDIPLLLRF